MLCNSWWRETVLWYKFCMVNITVPLVICHEWILYTNVTDRAGIEPRVARSRVQRLNHWAIKVPERPSRLRLTGSLHKGSITPKTFPLYLMSPCTIPDSKVHGANMGPTWVLSAPDGPHDGPMNIAIGDELHWVYILSCYDDNWVCRVIPW